MSELLGFIFAALALVGSPGPNTLNLSAAGAAFGYQRSVPYMVGLFVGMLGVMVVISTGVSGLFTLVPQIVPIITIAVAVYFLYLAHKIAMAPPMTVEKSTATPPPFFAGVMLSLVNPKAYVAVGAVFSGFVLSQESVWVDMVAKYGILAVLILVINMLWLLVGSMLTKYLKNPKTSRIINVTFAVLLLVSIIWPSLKYLR